MLATPVEFKRRFKIWQYVVSHGQLLLRSTKNNQERTRIDVLFKGVAFMHLATDLVGLSVSEGDTKELTNILPNDWIRSTERRAFKIVSEDFVGCVVAGSVFSHEDEGEYDDPSHFDL